MMQYRPSDRLTADQVLEHPWFRCCPSLGTVKGLNKAEQVLADLETLNSMKLDLNAVSLPNCFDR